MKTLTIIILLISSTLFAYDCQYKQEYNTSPKIELSGMAQGVYELAVYEFHPKHYSINNTEIGGDTILNAEAYTTPSYNTDVSYYFEVYLFEKPAVVMNSIREEYTIICESEHFSSNPTINLSELYFDQEVISRITLFMKIIDSGSGYPPTIMAKKISIKNMVLTNPEYPDYCEGMIQLNKSSFLPDDNLEMSLSLYYGYPSQDLDVYIVLYNGTQLYFYPGMTVQVKPTRLFLEQYTMTSQFIKIGLFEINSLNLTEGENIVTIGIAPRGTLDFLNEVYMTKFIYQKE